MKLNSANISIIRRLLVGRKSRPLLSILGRLEPEDVAALYRRSSIFLNPSLVDNMPNSVLEAYASGLPVVSTDVGGVPYIVSHEETGLLVPPGDAEAMAAAVRRLIEEPDLRNSLARAGLQQVQAYAWPEVRKQWLNHYSALAGRTA